ncbi:MAG: hypothetical protein ACREQA_04265 [Candidatus Binatia bacterium]
MAAIVFGNLAFDLSPRKLVVFRVDRSDLPHFTSSWNNPSGEVDIHLTPAFPRDECDRESILKIQESDLKTRLRDLGKQVWELVQKNPIQIVLCVNPKWLASRGYFLIGPRDGPVTMWLRGALPKKRGEYRLDERVLKQLPTMVLYPPTARSFTKLGQEGQIYAVCKKGSHRGTMLVLQRLDLSPASPTWVAVDYSDMDTLRALKWNRLLPQWFASLAPGAWQRIHDALQLHEFGL